MSTESLDTAGNARHASGRPLGAQDGGAVGRLAAFFALTFAISWLLWLPQVLDNAGWVDLPDAVGLAGMFAPFGPSIAALWLTGRQGGRQAVKALLKRGWSFGFDKLWLLPTVLLMPVASLVTVAVMAVQGLKVEWQYGAPWQAWLPTFVIILLLNALPEEYGWRGYALPRMLRRRGALAASLVLGAIWGLWHLPLFLIEGTVQSAIPVYQFILQQMALAVFYTWLYNHTRGAVSVSILFHAVGNLVGAAVPYWTTERGRWNGFAVLVVFVIGIVLIWGPRHLSRSGEGRHESAR